MVADARAIGQRIGAGAVRVLTDVASMHESVPSEVLVADTTDPDWEPIMKRASGIESMSLNPDTVVDTWLRLSARAR